MRLGGGGGDDTAEDDFSLVVLIQSWCMQANSLYRLTKQFSYA